MKNFVEVIFCQLHLAKNFEILPIFAKIICLIPNFEKKDYYFEQISLFLTSTRDVDSDDHLSKISRWNQVLINDKLAEKFDSNDIQVSQIYQLRPNSVIDDDFYRLSKFLIVIDKQSAINWLLMVKFLIHQNNIEKAKFM